MVLDMRLHAFLERFSRLRRGDVGMRTNAQRLLKAAIFVSSNFAEERTYKNSHFVAVGGLTTAELELAPELDFHYQMQLKLNVCVSVFQSYCCHLEWEASYSGNECRHLWLETFMVHGKEHSSSHA
ncbi:hypothetical protein ACP70R_020966 [Stipagrostis hirtigluma subsp. patula]